MGVPISYEGDARRQSILEHASNNEKSTIAKKPQVNKDSDHIGRINRYILLQIYGEGATLESSIGEDLVADHLAGRRCKAHQ